MSPRGLGLASVSVLTAISQNHRYGFDIIERTGLPSGTVYPALAGLERRRLVESSWEEPDVAEARGRPRRRYYRMTAAGRRELEAADQRLRGLGLSDGPRPAGEPG